MICVRVKSHPPALQHEAAAVINPKGREKSRSVFWIPAVKTEPASLEVKSFWSIS
jgi:hypothetical protein